MNKLFDFLGIIVFINEVIIACLMLVFVSFRGDISELTETEEKVEMVTGLLAMFLMCIEVIIIIVSIILNIFY